MQVYVNVELSEAIKRGSDRHGLLPVDIDLESLSAPQREVLARLVETTDGRTIVRSGSTAVYYPPDYLYQLRGPLTVPEATAEAVIAALDKLVAGIAAAEAKVAEQKAREEAEEAARRAEAEEQSRLPVAEQVESHYGDWQVVNPLRLYEDIRGPAEQEVARRRADDKVAVERAAAERLAAEERRKAERRSWIEAHGSQRLQRMLAEGIEHDAVYRDERLAADRPGWRYYLEVPGDYDDPRNPPAEAFELLDRAREMEPKAKLVYWTVEHNEHNASCYGGEECPRYDYRGYAAVAECPFEPDREIVFADGASALAYGPFSG